MVAQLGAQELKKKLQQGDVETLHSLRMGDQMSMAQLLARLSNAPPMAVLQLCNAEKGKAINNMIQQHSEDLDFVQEVLTAVGNHSELNPTMHAVLAGFTRRRNFGYFKNGAHNVDIDRLRFSHTASPKDADGGGQKKNDNSTSSNSRNQSTRKAICYYFQRVAGCNAPGRCKFAHLCILCDGWAHGA